MNAQLKVLLIDAHTGFYRIDRIQAGRLFLVLLTWDSTCQVD